MVAYELEGVECGLEVVDCRPEVVGYRLKV